MRLHGFIDLHTHGFGRYDTRTSAPEDILKLADFLGSAGTSAFLPTIYSGPLAGMRGNMAAVKKAMEVQRSEAGSGDKGSSFITQHSSLILGIHLEGPFLSPARCGALDKESFLKPTLSNLKKLLEDYEDIIKIITLAPELPGALKVIQKCSKLGIRVNMGHSDATFKQAFEGKKAGATGVTHIFNAMRPLHHREPGLAGFGLMDKDLYIEVIADGVHLHPAMLRLIFSVKRQDRIILVSDSVRGAKGKGQPVYKTKDILAGGGITLADSVKVLKEVGISEDSITKAGIHNPEILTGPSIKPI